MNPVPEPATGATAYPLPIAVAYRQVREAATVAQRQTALRDLGAALLKYLAAGTLAQYLARRATDPVVNRSLVALRQPGLLPWATALAATVDWWRRRGGAAERFVFPELLGRYNTPTREMPRTAALFSAVQGEPQEWASLGQLFTWFASEADGGAGAGPSAGGHLAALEAALQEVLDQLPSLTTRPLVYVIAVEPRDKQQTRVVYLPLMGAAPDAHATHEVTLAQRRTGMPQAGQLYLGAPDAAVPQYGVTPFIQYAGPGAPTMQFLEPSGARGALPSGAPVAAAGAEYARLLRQTTLRAFRRRWLLPGLLGAGLLALLALWVWPKPPVYNAVDAFNPAWSPDGRRIAFVSQRTGSPQVFVMNADGSDPTRLTQTRSTDFDPAWSPDGRRIAFASDRETTLLPELYVMNADGSGATRLTDRGSWEPAWSPDGELIAFRGYYSGSYLLTLIHPDGSAPTPFTELHGEDAEPTWSPDGRQLAFRAFTTYFEIFVMNRDGSGLQRITDSGRREADWEPAWSPDGRRIAFRAAVGEHNSDIYVMDADGSHRAQLTTHPASDASPAWSPDGRHLAFTTDRDGPLEIYVMNPDGSDQHALTRDDPALRTPIAAP
ncbi:MAG TPA: hypothetical protein VM536_01905 [Chloroflexia bacterium]|nr:hypothetical protein [Chloroflexia bacterium]